MKKIKLINNIKIKKKNNKYKEVIKINKMN